MHQQLDIIFENDEFSEQDKRTIYDILERLRGLISEYGYEKIVTTTERFPELEVGDPINIIPGDKGDKVDKCCRILLALAKGRGNTSFGFQNIMRQVRKHLIACSGITEIVIILTNVWDPAIFTESEMDIKSHMQQGKKFVFVLINGKQVQPMMNPYH